MRLSAFFGLLSLAAACISAAAQDKAEDTLSAVVSVQARIEANARSFCSAA